MLRTAGRSLAVLSALVLLSCDAPRGRSGPDAAPRRPAGPVTYLALGDSVATTEGGATRPYPVIYGRLASRALGIEVRVRNEAVPGSTSAELLRSLQTARLRRLVADAEIITVHTSGNDIAPGGDESRARACARSGDAACFLQILDETRETLAAIVREILELRDPDETVIRLADYYNPLPRNPEADRFGFPRRFRRHVPTLARAWSDAICDAAESEAIPCVRVSRAFNGPAGTGSPFRKGLLASDGTHLSDAGHRLVARELHAAGYAPLA